MATDCIIENWIKNMWQNHKVIVSSGLTILTLWVIAGVCLYISSDDNFMSNLFSAGSAIGTIGAVVTSLFLYNKSAKDNYDNMARSERAYMVVDLIQLKTFPINDINEFWVQFKNAGKSIAVKIKFNINYNSNTYPLPREFNFNDLLSYKDAGGTAVCAAGDTIESPIIHTNQELEAIIYQQVSNNYKYYVWGWIEYNDVFTEKRHRTEFCHFFEIKHVPDNNQYYVKVAHHDNFNSIDENCLHSVKTKP